MLERNEIKGKTKSEIKEMLQTLTPNDMVELIYDLAQDQPEPKKITLTRKQFEEHFQLSNETVKRGRPLGSKNNSIKIKESAEIMLAQKEFREALKR